MKGDPAERASGPSFVVCPPECAAAVRGALPPGCDLVVAGSPEEARAAFAARTGAPAADGGAGEATVDGRTVDLTTLERAVFEVLSRSPGRAFSRAELLGAVHGPQAGNVRLRAVDATVSGLRRKLGPSGWRVQTVWGRGYRWNAGEGPTASPFATAFRWSAGTLGVIVLAALLFAHPPRQGGGSSGGQSGSVESTAAPVAEPAEEAEPKSVEFPAGNVGPESGFTAPAAMSEPAAEFSSASVAPDSARRRDAAKTKVAAPAPSADSDACSVLSVAAKPAFGVDLPDPHAPLPPKEGFEVHVLTTEDKTLSNLARARGIALAELLAANPQIADPDVIHVGQPVYVPLAK